MNKNNHYLLHGVIHVKATGYWYTSGGEKGSFGYYPHLKSHQGFPLYPDTQIYGDLRMAAQWAVSLGASGDIIDKLFGRPGNDLAGLLRLGDLTLDKKSRETWTPDRFDIKARIEIDDQTRSVREHMLASFEAAWLDDLCLEAPLYAGYFTSREQVEAAKKILEEALPLLTGFGAYRSRGYGRGDIAISWQPLEEIQPSLPATLPEQLPLAFEALTNFRSKPVAAEQLQLVVTNFCLTSEQLRGWLVRSYHDLTGNWPSTDDMAGIRFSDFFPSPTEEAAYPPPVTVLRKEDGSAIEDCWGRPRHEEDNNENFVKIKEKPLKPGCFVTVSGRVHEARQGVRMRNAMEDGLAGGQFTTRKEGGLFVQQYLPAGTLFRGRLTFNPPHKDFSRWVYSLLCTTVKAQLNGTLFAIKAVEHEEPTGQGPMLATMPIPFDPARQTDDLESVTLGTLHRYAPVLGRPRRPQPAILPGSVLQKPYPGTLAWPLFGKKLTAEESSGQEDCPQQQSPKSYSPWVMEMHDRVKNLSRSQAGILRELLNPDHQEASIKKYLADIHEKHAEKDPNSSETRLYADLCQILQKDNINSLRSHINELLEYLKIEIWWDKLKKGDKKS